METIEVNKQISNDLLKAYKPFSPVVKKIATYIDQNSNFVLTTHIGSDADGISSQIALQYLLKQLNKKSFILNSERPPQYLNFIIPDQSSIETLHDYDEHTDRLRAKLKNCFAFILDNSEIKRTNKIGELIQELKVPWSSIDHHNLDPKPNYCVDASYAATAEIIWDLYKHYKIPLTKSVALTLYIGLISDSGNFRYQKTSLRTHLAGGELASLGVDTDQAFRAVYESNPVDRLIFIRRILEKVIINKKYGFVVGEVRAKMQRNLDLGDSASEGIVNLLLAAKGIKVAALVTETDEGYLKASLRSISNVDVAKIAQQFGGGGHKNAAGLKVESKFRNVKKQLIEAIKSSLS